MRSSSQEIFLCLENLGEFCLANQEVWFDVSVGGPRILVVGSMDTMHDITLDESTTGDFLLKNNIKFFGQSEFVDGTLGPIWASHRYFTIQFSLEDGSFR